MNVVRVIFGAPAQVAVGALFFLAAIAQTLYWEWVTPPTVQAIFIVSMEALAFAAYAIMATGFAVMWLDRRTPSAGRAR